MTPEARKETIQNAFKSIEAGNTEPLFEMLDDHIQWTIIGTSKYSDTFKGKQDFIDRLIAPLHEQLDGHIHMTPENFIADGDFVVVQGRGDEVVKVTEHLDTERVTTAFGR